MNVEDLIAQRIAAAARRRAEDKRRRDEFAAARAAGVAARNRTKLARLDAAETSEPAGICICTVSTQCVNCTDTEEGSPE